MWLLRERTITGAFLLAMIILSALAFVSYRTTQRLLNAEASTIHTYDVIETLDDILYDVTRVESATRGFILSGDQGYLDDYSEGRSEIEPELQDFQQLIADNPVQQQLLAEFRTPLAEKLAFNEELISLRSRNDLEGTLKRMGTRQGYRLMEDIQQRVERMKDEEKRLLQARTALAHRDAQLLTGILLSGSVISLGILSLVFFHLVREVRRRRASEARLSRVNHLFYILSQSNQAIVRIRDLNPLLNKVCRITVERGFFNLAWVGMIDEETRALKMAAASEDELMRSERPWLPLGGDAGGGHTEGLPDLQASFICNDIATDPRSLPEREKALVQGFRSVSVFPLLRSGRFVGVFCVYAAATNVFEDDIVTLLNEVSDDVSFALQSMEHEEIRRRSEEKIQRLNRDLESRIEERTAELALLNRELEERNKLLAHASQLKSEFVSRMSHELRTPLNAVSGYLDLLAEESAGELNAKQKRYVGHVRTGTAHLLELVNEVLDLSKIEAGGIQLHSEWFNASEALLEVLASTQPLAAVRNIAVEHALDPKFVIYADRVRFKQILYNLISNALKFTPEGGQVRIHFSFRDGSVHVSVTDNGIGISLEEQHLIFDEFHQGVTAKGVKEGTGLGLAITKRLIEEQGGKIWVDSEPGRGSQFTFTVPSPKAGAAGVEA